MAYRKLHTHPLNSLLRSALTRGAAGALGAATPLMALANPAGGQVVGGSATINTPSPNATVVNQSTQRAVIDWQSFSVGSGQYVQFVQPNSSSVVLNKVIGGTPSSIFGDIRANGQVFLVNPNGIYFAPGASIDVQGLVASTLDMDAAAFMQGKNVFSRAPGSPDATVVNQGSIVTARGGYVVLAGDYVENDGSINALAGRVVLAAGNSATLTLDQSRLVSYVVDGATLAHLAGVQNAGSITANGGGVIMTADVANALTATAVNNSGLVMAQSARSEPGGIVLLAKGGDIENSGTLDASAAANAPGVAGGTVILRGDGTTRVEPGSVITTGGNGAAGGLVELSGHTLDVRGTVSPGRGGDLLIDPFSLSIVGGSGGPGTTGNIGVGFIQNQLNAGVDVSLVASNAIGHAGSVTSLTATAGAGNLTIKTGTLTVGAGSLGDIGTASIGCNLTGVCKTGTSVVFTPTSGSINLSGMNIVIAGQFTADADAGNVNLSNVAADRGIQLNGAHITAASLIASSGNVLITGVHAPVSSTTITQTGTIRGKHVTIQESLGAASYGGSINVGNVTATTGNITITATASGVRMNIHAGSLSAAKAVLVTQAGHSGGISIGNVTAGANASSLGVQMQTTLLGASAGGGSINVGTITATGGVQLTAQGNTGSGAEIRTNAISAQYISLNATAKRGADISTGTLNATGTGSVSKNISLFAHANGTGTSHAYNASSGGNIRVTGGISGNGRLVADALGGLDSGGNIHVSGSVNMAGKATFLAVNEGSFGGTISISGAVTAKFVDMTARADWSGSSLRGANSNGAHISIGGNITATGTAPSASPSEGVNLRAGTASFANGDPSITVNGKITASNGAVNVLVNGRQGNRSIMIGNGSAGSGSIKAQHVTIAVQGTGSGGNIDVGKITTLGSGFSGNANIQTQGNGGSVHIGVHGAITVAGSSLFISNHGSASFRSVNISGAVHVNGSFGNANISAVNSASYGGAAVAVGNITANGHVGVSVSGHGSGGAVLNVGNITAASVSLDAINHGGGSAAISAGNLTAPQILVDAGANASSGQAAHIALGSINAVTASSDAKVVINATGKADTISTGKITLSGRALPSFAEVGPQPVGALLQVTTHGGSSDSINIGGTVKVTALATSGGNSLGDAVVEIGAFAGSSSTPPVANAPVSITGNLTVNAASDVRLFMHGSVSGAVAVTAGHNINQITAGIAIQTGGLALQAGTNINLAGADFSVGSGAAPGVAGDHAVTNLFGLGSIAPNAAFTAGGTLNLGNLAGSANYVLIRGDLATIGTVSLGSSALVQLTAATAGGTLGIGNAGGKTAYSAAVINAFSGFSVVLGDSAHTGTTTVGIANLGSTSITLVGNGIIKSSGLLTAGSLTLLGGNGDVTLTTAVGFTDVESGKNVMVDNTAFNGSASLLVASTGVGNLSYAFGGGVGGLVSDITVSGALTLKANGALHLGSDSLKAAKGITLKTGHDLVLGNAVIHAGSAFAAQAQGNISGSGAHITAKSASFTTTTGNVVLAGGTLQVTGALTAQAGGSLDLTSASATAANNVSLTAGKHILLGKAVVAAGGAFSADAHGSISDGGSGGSVAATGATFKAATGNVVLDGETLNTGAGNLAFSAAGSVVLDGANLHAGSMTVAAGSGLSLTGGNLHASKLTVFAGGSIDLSGETANVTNAIQLVAGFNGSGTALAAKDIILSGVNITTGVFEASAGGTIHNGGATGTLKANALSVLAGGDITLSSTDITVGAGAVPGVTGDQTVIAGLLGAGIGPTSLSPNAAFIAGGNLTLGNLSMTGSYLYLQAASVSVLGKVSVPTGTLVQVAPIDPAASIGFEDTGSNGSDFNLSNSGFLSLFPQITLVLGTSAETGDVALASNGIIDIGDDNLVVATSGTITGLDKVTSTGLVASLLSLLAPPVPPPTSSEIDPSSGNNTPGNKKHGDTTIIDVTGTGTGTPLIEQDNQPPAGTCH